MASKRVVTTSLSSRIIPTIPRKTTPLVQVQKSYARAQSTVASRNPLWTGLYSSPATTHKLNRVSYRQAKSPARSWSNTSTLYRSEDPKTTTQSFKEYQFEDITSALPSESGTENSPSSKPKITLIDVREPAELEATGIIPTSLPLPIASQPDALFLEPDEFLTRFGFPKPDTDSNLVFYCKAGVRARTAAELAVGAGYDKKKIGVYDGSWLDWAKKGGKTERWDGPDV